MNSIGIGLIGAGFMGKCHALAFGAMKAVFGDVPRPKLEVLCDVLLAKARDAAARFGFARATDDWCALVEDPKVDLVSITTPNALHHEMALAVIAAGKHVYCEKPMAVTLGQSGGAGSSGDPGRGSGPSVCCISTRPAVRPRRRASRRS